MAVLYVVATPIGNLGDITVRALEILREVDVIACEDTRRTRILLNHYAIATRTVAYGHDETRAGRVLGLLRAGHDVALVTDAGTPGVSDPGTGAVRAARDAGFQVVPVPGASALAGTHEDAGEDSERIAAEARALMAAEAERGLTLTPAEAVDRTRARRGLGITGGTQ